MCKRRISALLISHITASWFGGTELDTQQGGPRQSPCRHLGRLLSGRFHRRRIDQHCVPCLSCGQQLAFRDGREPRPVDGHDLALLHELRRGEAPR